MVKTYMNVSGGEARANLPYSGAPSQTLPFRVERGESFTASHHHYLSESSFYMEKKPASDPFRFEDLLLSMPSLAFHVRARYRAGTREVTARRAKDEGLHASNRPRKQEDLESNDYEFLYPNFFFDTSAILARLQPSAVFSHPAKAHTYK
jgi:hypothetical protein